MANVHKKSVINPHKSGLTRIKMYKITNFTRRIYYRGDILCYGPEKLLLSDLNRNLAHIHTHIHIYTHTYIYTHIHIYSLMYIAVWGNLDPSGSVT